MKLKQINIAILLVVLFQISIRSAWALAITGVGADPGAFDPAAKQSTQVRFKIDQRAKVTMRIYDKYERMIRSVASKGIVDPGEYKLSWDGKDGKGRLVPGEAYHYTLEAKGEDGSIVTYDLTDTSIGDVYVVKDVNWDKDGGKVNYSLTKPARINIRAGIDNYGPLLKTLLDWMPQQAGRHSFAWDGWDESRVLNIATHPRLQLMASAFNLPRNTIFVLPLPNKEGKKVEVEGQVQKRLVKHPKPARMHDDARKPAAERRDIDLILKLVNKYPEDAEGVPIVKGKVPIRIDVDASSYTYLSKQRFEPVFFLDGMFLSENESGFLPSTYVLDSQKYNPGTHYLTVNIVGFDGVKGSATVKLKVEKQ